MINNEESKEHSISLVDILKAAQFLFEIAEITGNQLAIALDKVFKHYAGYSALEAAGIDITAPEETGDTADEDDDDYYADGERVSNVETGNNPNIKGIYSSPQGLFKGDKS